MKKYNRILVTGGSGMIGSALKDLIPDAIFLSSRDGDLRKQEEANRIFQFYKPDAVIHLAARVGGVKANMQNMGSFCYDNILINTNVIEASYKAKVNKLLSTLSTCVYPDTASYPLTEEQIHNGVPHHSNYAYAYTKRMVDVQSRAYREQYGCNFVTVIPNNTFGMHDNFDLEDCHVIPAMIRKVYEAKKFNKKIVLWGDGTPLREFTYSVDMAKIILFLLEKYNSPHPINIGNTKEFSIKQISDLICKIYNYDGNIEWDISGPQGQFRKPSSDEKVIKLGWNSDDYTQIEESLQNVCDWFLENYHKAREVG